METNEVIYKKCLRCEEEKPLWEFGISKKGTLGVKDYCKECWENTEGERRVLREFKKKVRKIIRKSIKKKGYTKANKTEQILGCSLTFFKKHIESQFEPWMNWDNYGKYNGTFNFGWNLDHIIPLETAKSEEDIIRLNHYTNIQPLCGYINQHIKRNRVDWEKNLNNVSGRVTT